MKLGGHSIKNGRNRLLGAGGGHGDQQRTNDWSCRAEEANNNPAPRWAFRMVGVKSRDLGKSIGSFDSDLILAE